MIWIRARSFRSHVCRDLWKIFPDLSCSRENPLCSWNFELLIFSYFTNKETESSGIYFFSVAILGHLFICKDNHNNIGNIYYKYHLWKNSELGIVKSTLDVLTPWMLLATIWSRYHGNSCFFLLHWYSIFFNCIFYSKHIC